MARKTKLTPELQKNLVNYLALGNTVEDSCAAVGITKATYYNWYNEGAVASRGQFLDFFDAVTHAKSQARTAAVAAIRRALAESQVVTDTTETVTETRLRTVKRPDGTVEQVPYEHKRTVYKQAITKSPPDWRAGVEYLKRRDPANWSANIQITIDDLREKAIADIQAGRITYEALAAEDKSLADELFSSAGVPIEAGTRTAE